MIPILKWYFEKLDFIFIDRNKGFNSLKHTINSINNLVNRDLTAVRSTVK